MYSEWAVLWWRTATRGLQGAEWDTVLCEMCEQESEKNTEQPIQQ